MFELAFFPSPESSGGDHHQENKECKQEAYRDQDKRSPDITTEPRGLKNSTEQAHNEARGGLVFSVCLEFTCLNIYILIGVFSSCKHGIIPASLSVRVTEAAPKYCCSSSST